MTAMYTPNEDDIAAMLKSIGDGKAPPYWAGVTMTRVLKAALKTERKTKHPYQIMQDCLATAYAVGVYAAQHAWEAELVEGQPADHPQRSANTG